MTFFIPKKINVGYQNRSDTYTGKLAYIIYFDEKGKLRKETSWNGWRKKELGNDIFDNEPTDGFVLNKKVGGYRYGWDSRSTYIRVYDPRGFEFEITVQNLIYILENTNSIKGKGLDGDFVYGWDGKDLVLIPCGSPDYENLVSLNKLRHSDNKIGARELNVGHIYRTKDNESWMYMGKFFEYGYNGTHNGKKRFFFAQISKDESILFRTISSPTQKLVEVISNEISPLYPDAFDKLQSSRDFSPIDDSKDVYTPITLEEFKESIGKNWQAMHRTYSEINGAWKRVDVYRDGSGGYYYTNDTKKEVTHIGWSGLESKRMDWVREKILFDTIEDAFNTLKPHILQKHLANGRKWEGYY